MYTIVVTGGAGFIGSHLVDALVKRDDVEEVVVIDDLSLGTVENLAEARESNKLVEHLGDGGDCTDYILEELLMEHTADVIFNLAVMPLPHSLEHPWFNFMRNVEMTANILDTLRKCGWGARLIHFSSSEVYGTCLTKPMTERHWLNPTTPYAAAKAACDHLVVSYVNTFGIDAVILRPFNVIGPRQNSRSYAGVIPKTISNILHGWPPELYGDGENTRDYTYVGDVVKAAQLIWEQGERGETYNVCRGKPVTINHLMKEICRLMGYDFDHVNRLKDRRADVKIHIGSVNKFWELTGWGPEVDFDEALRRTVKWYVR